MKKLILLSWLLCFCGTWIQASVLSIKVPEALLSQDSSLMLYLQDYTGQQLVGTCQLHNACFQRTISEKDLFIQSMDSSVETHKAHDGFVEIAQIQEDQSRVVILEFLFDREIQILKVFIVKSDVYDSSTGLTDAEEIMLEQNNHRFAEFDFDDDLAGLSEFVDGFGDQDRAVSFEKQELSVRQYLLLAELFVIMQYGKAKRVLSSWF